ncbi:CPBP family intramembrane metalloprotease [Aerococcaceae bacterium DSM 111020]|nr:CPBP family intramembrane metalloprotease [Aerococcaceae bacterium DSM 111020]
MPILTSIISPHSIILLIGVIGAIIFKYGLLSSFVLSRWLTHPIYRELVDSLMTVLLMLGLAHLFPVFPDSLTNGKHLINICYVLVAIILYYAIQVFIGELFGLQSSYNQKEIEKLNSKLPFWTAVLSTAIVAPLFEEYIFRLCIQDLCFGNGFLAIALTALLFSSLHMFSGFSLGYFLTYACSSIILSTLYRLTGGLFYSSLMHILVDLFAVIAMYSPSIKKYME